MKIHLIFNLILIAILQFNCSQPKTENKTKMSFIPQDFQVRDSLVIDFNKDGINDFVMALQSSLPDSSTEETLRILMILKGINSTDYKLSARNDTLLWCKTCGGMMGDPFDGFYFDSDTLEVSQAGGSACRWGVKYFIVFNHEKDNWSIVKKYSFSYDSLDPEESFEDSTIIYNPKIKF